MDKRNYIKIFQYIGFRRPLGFWLCATIAALTCPARGAPEDAELLTRLPPSTIKPLQGSIETKQFGAAGLARAFDLANDLAGELCSALPADRKTAIYEPATVQGILAARMVADAVERLKDDLNRQNKELQQLIEAHAPQGSAAGIAFSLLTAVPATLKAGAELSSLFKTDVAAQGIAYGEGARSLFATQLARRCPDKLAGLGAGYLGELDSKPAASLLARVRALAAQRGEFAQRIAVLDRLADAAKGEEKRNLAAVVQAAGAMLKGVDAFVDSLKAGEASERSPLFNAARYLGYAARTEGMPMLDFDLRLEGMTIVKDALFTGQKLRLSGVAFLWYRLHEPDGRLLVADAVRRVARPVEVDLRGDGVDQGFFDAPKGLGFPPSRE